jgi:hypothetical protein
MPHDPQLQPQKHTKSDSQHPSPATWLLQKLDRGGTAARCLVACLFRIYQNDGDEVKP